MRNSVGMVHRPVTRELWATNDNPNDTLIRVPRRDEDHGFPHCVGNWADPDFIRGRNCGEFAQRDYSTIRSDRISQTG